MRQLGQVHAPGGRTVLLEPQVVQADVPRDMLRLCGLLEETSGALDGTPIDDPDGPAGELVKKARVLRANTSQARHLGELLMVQLARDAVRELPGKRAARARKDERFRVTRGRPGRVGRRCRGDAGARSAAPRNQWVAVRATRSRASAMQSGIPTPRTLRR